MMNNGELVGKVCSSMYRQCRERGYATPVDVLMEIGVLPKKKHEDWRFGRIPYLESVCTVNLHKLSFVMHQMRVIWNLAKQLLRTSDLQVSVVAARVGYRNAYSFTRFFKTKTGLTPVEYRENAQGDE